MGNTNKTTPDAMAFERIRENYYEARRDQLAYLSRSLAKEPEIIKCRVKCGSDKYNSKGRMESKYDMRVWRWLDVDINEVHFVVTIQPFEKDSSTSNKHVLMDRIGIYAYIGEYSPIEAQTQMLITDISLPLDINKVDKIKAILKDLSECEYFKLKKAYDRICKENNLTISEAF